MTTSSKSSNLLARLAGDWRVLLALAIVLFTATTVASFVRKANIEPLPILGQVPEFRLTAETGEEFGTQQLTGYVWVANFIFTRCPTVCPVFTQKMQGIQKRTRNLGLRVRLVSFSVDPDYDTPERLMAYAKEHSYNQAKWKFLTGLPEDVRKTVRDGLKIAMEDEGMVEDVPEIIHGTHFVLVDQQGRIRGYYDSNDPAEIDELVRHVGHLVNNPD